MPMLAFFERHRLLLSVVLLAAATALGAATRVTLRAPEKEYKATQEAYRARDFDIAIPRLEQWVAVDRDTFKQATALYQLGVSYSDQENYAAAVQTHERLRFEFPNVNYGAGTIFHLARNKARLGELDSAYQYATMLEVEHPDTNWSKRLRREHPEIFANRPGG